jgi:hypothetical protein
MSTKAAWGEDLPLLLCLIKSRFDAVTKGLSLLIAIPQVLERVIERVGTVLGTARFEMLPAFPVSY